MHEMHDAIVIIIMSGALLSNIMRWTKTGYSWRVALKKEGNLAMATAFMYIATLAE